MIWMQLSSPPFLSCCLMPLACTSHAAELSFLLLRGNGSGTARALVRMQSIAEATNAILALNGRLPRRLPGEPDHQPLLVRYADGPEEKARKQAQTSKQLQAALRRRYLRSDRFTTDHLTSLG